MTFNYRKLLGRMRERGITQIELAKSLNISAQALNNKLNGRSVFTQREIFASCDALGIEPTDIPQYFFTLEVEKIATA